jgi:hypothetical protein
MLSSKQNPNNCFIWNWKYVPVYDIICPRWVSKVKFKEVLFTYVIHAMLFTKYMHCVIVAAFRMVFHLLPLQITIN